MVGIAIVFDWELSPVFELRLCNVFGFAMTVIGISEVA